jgi:hypothetical protein
MFWGPPPLRGDAPFRARLFASVLRTSRYAAALQAARPLDSYESRGQRAEFSYERRGQRAEFPAELSSAQPPPLHQTLCVWCSGGGRRNAAGGGAKSAERR